MTISDINSEAKELDARVADGIDVRLLWYPGLDTVTVVVSDSRRQTAFELAVASDAALDAFHHPFAYAAQEPVSGFVSPTREQQVAA